jgi:hypothetical protein
MYIFDALEELTDSSRISLCINSEDSFDYPTRLPLVPYLVHTLVLTILILLPLTT